MNTDLLIKEVKISFSRKGWPSHSWLCGEYDIYYDRGRVIAINKAGEGQPSNTVMAVL